MKRGVVNFLKGRGAGRTVVAAAFMSIGFAGLAADEADAQQVPFFAVNAEGAGVEVLPLRGSIYVIAGAGGNITVSAGTDGVLLVDSGPAAMTEEVTAAIERIKKAEQIIGGCVTSLPSQGASVTRSHMPWNPSMNYLEEPCKPVQYIINTSADADHTGGNEPIAAAGVTYTSGNVAREIADAAATAQIYGHENVLVHMLDDDRSEGALPTLTYFTDQWTLGKFFNGEGVRMLHIPAAHTDGDTVVYFRQSDVIAAGDLFNMETYPAIDLARGGNINGIITGLQEIMDLAMDEFRTEGGTLIVPGHGRITDRAEVGYYRDMLMIIRARVQQMIDEGMTLAQIQEARPTMGYDGRYGVEAGPWTTEMFVEAVFRNLAGDG